MKTANAIRNQFIQYFVGYKHQQVPSSRLVPEDDPTLLFTNAGMNQFKNTFLGIEPRDYKRAVSVQKCVRAGGKHNDLDNVGFTARHHTFFEMLGNFSFGDYFKKDAIHFAWDFIIKELGLPKDRLYVTVFEDDDEAADLWHKQEGVPKERIYRFGEKDNFWRMGDTGPCGPCSEIFYDLGPEIGGDPKENVMGGSGDRFIEFWNLVFMQFNEQADGSKIPLPNPSVDTGMGLERLTMILQGETNNYHTDLFQNLIGRACGISGKEYVKDISKLPSSVQLEVERTNVALRVLADHARAAAFLIADGVMPANDGRGYVLRRIMRRGIRYGRQLSDAHLLPGVVEQVIADMSHFYPELKQQQALIETTVKDEEKRFLVTLDQGTQILADKLKALQNRGQKTLDGETVFKLYDTFGFPVDLTRLMAKEEGFTVDEAGFDQKMQAAREKAKKTWKAKSISSDAQHLIKMTQDVLQQHGPTTFSGYHGITQDTAKILALSNGKELVESLEANESGFMIVEPTCFYAESGGQVGDTGIVLASQGQAEVFDCSKQNEIHLHHIRVTEGRLNIEDTVQLQVERSARRNTANNHSATHLLHSALRQVLGTHVTQAGSLVDPDRLRFDFTHNQPLSDKEIERIENIVNDEISTAHPVTTKVMSPEDAISGGALALFGEKYGDKVRVIQMGPTSIELCGGTHVDNTAMIRIFKIVSESGVSAGVRRIEAVTGDIATRYLLKNTQENLHARAAVGLHENWASYLQGDDKTTSLETWIESAKQDNKNLQREIQSLKGASLDVNELVNAAQSFSSSGQEGRLLFAKVAIDDRKALSDITDKLRDKLRSGVVILIGDGEGSHPVIVSVTSNFKGKINAGHILKEIAPLLGGKGGGRPDFAQGAASDLSQLAQAKEKAYSLLSH